MREFGRLILIVVLAGLAGCSSIPERMENSPQAVRLTLDGGKVALVDFIPEAERSKYTEVAMVRCGLGGNGQDRETNKESCLNNLRNQAARMGGRYVIMSDADVKRVPRCGNCIEMKGIVLSQVAE